MPPLTREHPHATRAARTAARSRRARRARGRGRPGRSAPRRALSVRRATRSTARSSAARVPALRCAVRGARPARTSSRRGARLLARRLSTSSSSTISRQPVDLAQRRVQLVPAARRCARGLRLLEAQPQAGQRGAQLVRRVGHEAPLGAERAGEPVGHLVERARERALLARCPPPARARSRSPSAMRRAACVEPPQRARHWPRDHAARPRGPSSSTSAPISASPPIVRRTAR